MALGQYILQWVPTAAFAALKEDGSVVTWGEILPTLNTTFIIYMKTMNYPTVLAKFTLMMVLLQSNKMDLSLLGDSSNGGTQLK